MKNIFKILCIGIVLSITYSCKKGENDPFLSLRSRKARITGEWKLASSSETSTNTSDSGSSTTVKNFDGTTETEVYTGILGSPVTSTKTLSEEYTFEKDGTFKVVRTEIANGNTDITTGEGNWAFVGKSKTAELKNKESISLSFTKFTYSDNSFEEYSGTFLNYSSLMIEQLKNKEIVISYDDSGTNVNTSQMGGWDNSWTRKGTQTWTKK